MHACMHAMLPLQGWGSVTDLAGPAPLCDKFSWGSSVSAGGHDGTLARVAAKRHRRHPLRRPQLQRV